MKVRNKKIFFASLLLVGMLFNIYGCKSNLSPEEYRNWVMDESNGLHQTKNIDQCRFELLYKPCDYMIAIDYLKGNNLQNITSYHNDKMEYLDLKIEMLSGKKNALRNNLSSDEDYYSRLNYLNFSFSKDILMISGTDTLPCVFYHFENTYDAQSANHILLGFDGKKNTNDNGFQILLYPKFLNVGIVKFAFENNDLTRLPKLKI